jgi:hypothetical protein
MNKSMDLSIKQKELKNLTSSIASMSPKEIKDLIITNNERPSALLQNVLRTVDHRSPTNTDVKLIYTRPKF